MNSPKSNLINTPLQRGGPRAAWLGNRFNGFSHRAETVETVPHSALTTITPLKRGVNERCLDSVSAQLLLSRSFRISLVLACLFSSFLHSAIAADGAGEAPLFPAHSILVLLAGLPGDVESEKSYRDQLQSWLELLDNTPVAPEKVFILWDDLGWLVLPAKMPAQVIHASREEFLALGKTLAGTTNPLVVIAWGHGGMQGRAPVFHIRGPRLTPDDFKAFAAQSPLADSHWLLFFRGSGAFAGALAGERRQIISSENQTMFTSDPIGTTPLLKLARANPAISFAALGQQLGRAIAAWYTDRKLARTEEPTFWDGTEKPRLLAAENAETLASEPAAKPAAKPAAEPPPANTTNSPAPTAGLPSAWKDISRVDPQKYPDADGVVLRRRVSYTFGSNPAMAAEHDEFMQILTAEGKHFGDFDFAYSPPFENITFAHCEVWQTNGNVLRLDPDEIRDAPEESVGDYQRPRRKFFSLPGVSPGAVLHVHYLSEWKTYPLPHVSLEIPILAELPVLDSALEVSVPKDSPFHFILSEGFEDKLKPALQTDPVINQTTYGSRYSWQFHDLPALEHEILAPPHGQPALLISTFPDWADFADWYGRLTKLTDVVTPEIAAKAATLTSDARTDREKVLALYNYVTSLRYVAVPLGVNSFRPHAAANVLKNQFGDCKDKANLFNTLLHSLNIEAHLVLVPRFTQAHEAIPGFAFNHAISRVTLGGDTLWVDTTDEDCRFGLLPPGDPGRKVLVIDGKSNALTQLPSSTPSEHRFALRAQVDCADLSVDLPVTLSVSTAGFPDYALRSAARQLKDHKTTVPLLAAHFQPAAGVFGLEKQTFTSVSALGEDFEWHAEGACIAIHSRSDGKWTLRAPFWLPKEWNLALHQRKTALFLNQGYPVTLDEEFTFTLPEKAPQLILPAVRENTEAPLHWKIDWAKMDRTIIARLHVELARGGLSSSETPALQPQLRALFTSLAAGSTFAVAQ